MTVQNPSDFDFETGLEDFTLDDAVTPRLKIVHKQGVFEDTLSGQQFPTIRCIMLGLVKQRILWHHKIDDNAKNEMPMCKSNNHDIGFPLLSEEVVASKRFPWAASGFDPANFPPDENGLVRLPCDKCALKEWDSHPMGGKPYCSEQFTVPVLYDANSDGVSFVPAIISFQKTSLKPLKAYFTGFQRARNAAFMAYTDIGLDLTKRGDNEYSVPTFRKVGDTEDQDWRGYSAQYRQMRDFLVQDSGMEDFAPEASVSTPDTAAATPGTVDQDGIEEAQVVENHWKPPAATAPPQAPTAPPQTPAAPAAPVTPTAPADDSDDLPF